MRRIIISLTVAGALFASPALASRRYYSGGHHTHSHGGHYAGGHGSSHRGGHYRNARTGNHYGRHH